MKTYVNDRQITTTKDKLPLRVRARPGVWLVVLGPAATAAWSLQLAVHLVHFDFIVFICVHRHDTASPVGVVPFSRQSNTITVLFKLIIGITYK